MKQQEQINFFIKPIYDRKKKYSIRSWIEYIKFKKYLKTVSPNYDMLVGIYEFILLLEQVYMYNNSPLNKESYIYAIREKTRRSEYDCSFVVCRGSFRITYNLKHDEKIINIHITRSYLDKTSFTTNITFPDGKSVINDTDEENMFLNIINITMDAVSDIFSFYWKNKFRGY